MPFDMKAFKKADFEARTGEVHVPGLKDFFDEGEKPVFKVRSVSGIEMAKANEATKKNRNLQTLLEGMLGGEAKEQVASFKSALGLDEKVPDDIAKRIELFTMAVVEPEVDREMAVLLSERFPVEFTTITNKILELTGKGQMQALAKKKKSSETQPSK